MSQKEGVRCNEEKEDDDCGFLGKDHFQKEAQKEGEEREVEPRDR